MCEPLREARAKVRAHLELDAVIIETDEFEMVLSPAAAVDLVLRLIKALDQLHQPDPAGWVEQELERIRSHP
jgi:hypothetical protein